MKTITKITFSVYSSRNSTRYPHTIYVDGTLNFKEIMDYQMEWINGRGSAAKLKFEDTKVEFYQLIENS